MNVVKVEGVGLVVGLAGTGSDPPPSSRRQMLINEMQARNVENPNQVLASTSTSLVLVRGFLPPGVQKGDPIDVEVRVPSRSQTTSLRGGWLMQTRLREMAVLNNRIASGHVLALAQGDVLVDALIRGTDDEVWLTQGNVLGGGVSMTTRAFGLAVREEHHSVRTSAQIGAAINTRFHTYERGIKKGVATPLRDNLVRLVAHPRYKDNLVRYIRVIESIPVRESPSDRVARIQELKHDLLSAASAARAAIRLEALDREGEPAIVAGLQSSDEEVRFYAAEALAYMNRGEAAPVLAESARRLPAFRLRALTALGAMEDPKAYDELAELMHVPSAETRYGAFRVLADQNPDDPLVAGENLEQKVPLHVVSSLGEPMVHITRSRRPEIVLFGHNQPLAGSVLLFASKKIMVKGEGGDELSVTHYSADQDDRTERCAARLDEMIRTLVRLGASYTEVVQAIQQAKQNGNLASRVEFDALPRSGRTYKRNGPDDAWETTPEEAADEEPELTEITDVPELTSPPDLVKSRE
jgi:flagellar basal body P-ring protein FlgI